MEIFGKVVATLIVLLILLVTLYVREKIVKSEMRRIANEVIEEYKRNFKKKENK